MIHQVKRLQPCEMEGVVQVPPSKSDSQRAILCAALSPGKSIIHQVGNSLDERNMMQAIQDLGASIHFISESSVEVVGISNKVTTKQLNVGESGLAMRLLTCVCAMFDSPIELTGHGSLVNRSMHFFEERLPQLGVAVSSNDGKIPIRVNGPLNGNKVTIEKTISSQYISGLLIAASFRGSDFFIQIEDPVSEPYIDMTIQTLLCFGVVVERQSTGYFLKGGQELTACEYQVESDWSSASYWLLAAAIGHNIQIAGLNLGSKQADKAFMNALLETGCQFKINNNLTSVTVDTLSPFSFDATHCPDLFPALVVLAAKCTGTTEIKGMNRLIHKESNRALSLKTEFEKLGLNIRMDGDRMFIEGNGKLIGALVSSHNDHRIAMCLAIASTFASGQTVLSDYESVAKSYPNFWQDYEMLKK